MLLSSRAKGLQRSLAGPSLIAHRCRTISVVLFVRASHQHRIILPEGSKDYKTKHAGYKPSSAMGEAGGPGVCLGYIASPRLALSTSDKQTNKQANKNEVSPHLSVFPKQMAEMSELLRLWPVLSLVSGSGFCDHLPFSMNNVSSFLLSDLCF